MPCIFIWPEGGAAAAAGHGNAAELMRWQKRKVPPEGGAFLIYDKRYSPSRCNRASVEHFIQVAVFQEVREKFDDFLVIVLLPRGFIYIK